MGQPAQPWIVTGQKGPGHIQDKAILCPEALYSIIQPRELPVKQYVLMALMYLL